MRLFLRQFTSPIVLILFLATAISIIAGDIIDGLIILAIIIPSGLLSYFQEARAGKIMQSLLAQLHSTVTVIRNGVTLTIDSTEVLVGDIITLSVGDLVPADMKVTTATQVLIDESVLTGESFPAEKTIGADIYQASHIVSGTLTATVEATGFSTRFGQLEQHLKATELKTTFEKGIEDFGKLLAQAMLVLVTAIFISNIYFHRSILESLLFSLALAVGLTPQLLPAIVSVSLSAGARVMASKKVLVRRLDVIEDFGSMTALCTDKTGTLTTGVVQLEAALNLFGVADDSVLELAALNAGLQKSFTNPMDAAILQKSAPNPQVRVLAELPYDFQRRRLSVLTDNHQLITKGALHSILEVCKPLSPEQSTTVEGLFQSLSATGARVIGIASKPLAGSTLQLRDESDLELQGLLVFRDPLKEDSADAIALLKKMGISPYLITGDNPLAAAHIGSLVGLETARVIDGKAIATMSDGELKAAVDGVYIFAEVDPLQKERIVKALQSIGHTVGYFGDGINDSAAIKAADVGISVENAVQVAKAAAAVVLLDSDLHVLAEGVRIGRKTFVNTMKYIKVGVSAAFGNMLSMAVASLFLPFLPLLPVQILLLNFLSDFPALMIAGDSVDSEVLDTPQQWDISAIRKFAITFGLISSFFDLATFWILINLFHADETLFRSAWFVESTLTELAVMLILRTQRHFWKSRPGKGLLYSSMALAALVVAIPYSWLGQQLQIDGLPLALIGAIAFLIVIYGAINEFIKGLIRS
jgi:Mg2+-importing ATPase